MNETVFNFLLAASPYGVVVSSGYLVYRLLRRGALRRRKPDCSIYILIDPTRREVRYVGKSVDPSRRMKQHLGNASPYSTKESSRWIFSLRQEGIEPVMMILETVKYEKQDERERYWIKQYLKRGAQLTNMNLVGDG